MPPFLSAMNSDDEFEPAEDKGVDNRICFLARARAGASVFVSTSARRPDGAPVPLTHDLIQRYFGGHSAGSLGGVADCCGVAVPANGACGTRPRAGPLPLAPLEPRRDRPCHWQAGARSEQERARRPCEAATPSWSSLYQAWDANDNTVVNGDGDPVDVVELDGEATRWRPRKKCR